MTQVKGLRRPLFKTASPIEDAIKNDALKDILTVGGMAAAGGIGARGLLGLRYMFGRRKPNLTRALGPTVLSVPTPVYANAQDEARAQKYAGVLDDVNKGFSGMHAKVESMYPGVTSGKTTNHAGLANAASIAGSIAKPLAIGAGAYGLYRALKPKPKPIPAAEKTAAPHILSDRTELPWYYPGVTMAGVGGLAGGYKLMDYLMDKKRKADLADETEEAKAQYHQAMLDQYNPASVPAAGVVPDFPVPTKTVNPMPGAAKMSLKAAALQNDLDAMCEEVEKFAAEKQAMPGWMGQGLGAYGALASLLALGSGTAAYKFTKDRSTNKLMEDAIKQRERERWGRRPPEIYAVPTPVKLTRKGDLSQIGQTPVLPGTEGM